MKERKPVASKTRGGHIDLSALRKKAEAKLKKRMTRIEGAEAKDREYLMHELMTHQIELEMQNEELRRAQGEIESSRARYADLYNFAPVGYFTFDIKGVVRELNLTAAEMLGFAGRARDIVGKPFLPFVAGRHKTVFLAHCRLVLRSAEKQTCEILLQRKDGTKFAALIESIAFHGGSGEDKVCLTSVSDVTERRKSEDEIARLNGCLAERNIKLEEFNRELESFSYAVSHDLKAPLRTISGMSNILLKDYSGRLDEQARDYLDHLVRASSRMDRLIDALLSLSRLTRSELNVMDINLTGLAREIAWELKSSDERRSVEFIIQEDLNATADLYLMRIAVRNLFENAWKFTSKLASARVEFGSEIRQGETVFFVRDNGVGFDMKYADKLFNPFQRLHSEKEYEGTGIGLTTVSRVIRMMGGRIWAESKPGVGTTFFFTIGEKDRTSPDAACC